jgi:hypothetical protein
MWVRAEKCTMGYIHGIEQCWQDGSMLPEESWSAWLVFIFLRLHKHWNSMNVITVWITLMSLAWIGVWCIDLSSPSKGKGYNFQKVEMCIYGLGRTNAQWAIFRALSVLTWYQVIGGIMISWLFLNLKWHHELGNIKRMTSWSCNGVWCVGLSSPTSGKGRKNCT